MHVIQAEGGLIHVRWVGEPSLWEVQQIYNAVEGYLDPRGHGLVLFCLKEVQMAGPELRHYAAQWWRRHAATVALASYGMSQEVRLVRELVARGIALLSAKALPSANFATEAEARSWLLSVDRQRAT